MRETIKIMMVIVISACNLMSVMSGRSYAGELKSTEMPTVKQPHCIEKEERGTISVTGEVKDFFIPDTAVLTLAVETTEKTAGEAVTENSKRAEKVVKALKLLISPDRGDSIRTSSFAVLPVYEYDNVNKKNLLTGYRARHQVTVRTKKTEMAGMIIDSAIQNGANQVYGVNFALAETKGYCEGALKKAVDGAKREAAFVARTLGTKISGIKSISPTCGTETSHPVYRQSLMAAQAAPVPETTIEAGDIAVNASVVTVFYIEEE